MNSQTKQSRFIVASVPSLYQQLLTSNSLYLVNRIRTLYAFRDTQGVREIAAILCTLPQREYRLIGDYYRAWCECREGNYCHLAFERIAEQSFIYRSKSLISRAALEVYQGNSEQAFSFYREALKTSRSLQDSVDVLRGTAMIKSIEGFHSLALDDIEKLIPVLRHVEPLTYFEVLNSYAVELMEVGRVEEARNISRIVLASPYSFVYPEWLDTSRDINLRGYKLSRSIVSFAKSNTPKNLVHLPEREPSPSEPAPLQKAQVLNLLEWKKKMGKEPNGDNEPKDEKDVFFEAMEIFSSTKISEKKKWKMLELIRKIANEPDDPTG